MGNPPDGSNARTVPRRPGEVKCNAATPADNSTLSRRPFFSWRRMRRKVPASEMELAMRMMWTASLAAVGGILAGAPAQAQWTSAFQANDTGGIIAYPLTEQTDVRQLAVDHCASYGKVVKFLAVDPQYGGYISFACRWVPYGANDRPLVTKY
jgi:hypothetical protein